jgi:hypothetical protein
VAPGVGAGERHVQHDGGGVARDGAAQVEDDLAALGALRRPQAGTAVEDAPRLLRHEAAEARCVGAAGEGADEVDDHVRRRAEVQDDLPARRELHDDLVGLRLPAHEVHVARAGAGGRRRVHHQEAGAGRGRSP